MLMLPPGTQPFVPGLSGCEHPMGCWVQGTNMVTYAAFILTSQWCADALAQMELRRQPGQPVRSVAVTSWSADSQLEMRARLHAFLPGDRAATVQSYACQQRQYAFFCYMLSVPAARHFEPMTIAQWIMGRAVHGYKVSTVELGVHAIGALCGHSSWRSTEIRRAAARLRGSAVVRKSPMLHSLLAGMVSAGDGAWRARQDACF